MNNVLHLRTQPTTCPSWCIRNHHDDAFHVSDFHGHREHDEGGQTVFALGGRVVTLVPGQRPTVEVLLWAAEDGIVTAQENHPIAPAEARHIAGALLRLAEEADGTAPTSNRPERTNQ